MGLTGFACMTDFARSVSVCDYRNSTKPINAANTDVDFAAWEAECSDVLVPEFAFA